MLWWISMYPQLSQRKSYVGIVSLYISQSPLDQLVGRLVAYGLIIQLTGYQNAVIGHSSNPPGELTMNKDETIRAAMASSVNLYSNDLDSSLIEIFISLVKFLHLLLAKATPGRPIDLQNDPVLTVVCWRHLFTRRSAANGCQQRQQAADQ
jgi:hypothetical protein